MITPGADLTVRARAGEPLGECPLQDYALEPLVSDLHWQCAPYLEGETVGEVVGLVRPGASCNRVAALLATLQDASTRQEVACHPYPITAQCISGAVEDLFGPRRPAPATDGEPPPTLVYEICLDGRAAAGSSRLVIERARARWRFAPIAKGEPIADLLSRSEVYGDSRLDYPLVFFDHRAFQDMAEQMADSEMEAMAGLMGRAYLDARTRLPYIRVERAEPLTDGVAATAVSVTAGPDAVGALLGGAGVCLVGLAHSHPGLAAASIARATLSTIDHATIRKRLRRAYMFSVIVNVCTDGRCTYAIFGWHPRSGGIGGLPGFLVLPRGAAGA